MQYTVATVSVHVVIVFRKLAKCISVIYDKIGPEGIWYHIKMAQPKAEGTGRVEFICLYSVCCRDIMPNIIASIQVQYIVCVRLSPNAHDTMPQCLGPLFLRWINFNPTWINTCIAIKCRVKFPAPLKFGKGKLLSSHPLPGGKWFFLSMLELKLNHVSERGSWKRYIKFFARPILCLCHKYFSRHGMYYPL